MTEKKEKKTVTRTKVVHRFMPEDKGKFHAGEGFAQINKDLV